MPATGVAFVHIVAVGAAHLAVQHLVSVGQAELRAFVEMALEARLGRFTRIDNRAGGATGGDVQAAGAVAGFAAGVTDLWVREREARMAGRGKVIGLVGVAVGARFRANEFRAGNLRRCKHRAVGGDTPDQDDGPQSGASEDQGGLSGYNAVEISWEKSFEVVAVCVD